MAGCIAKINGCDVKDIYARQLLEQNLIEHEAMKRRDEINPAMFGAVGDGETDDSVALQACIDYAHQYNLNINCLGKSYLVSHENYRIVNERDYGGLFITSGIAIRDGKFKIATASNDFTSVFTVLTDQPVLFRNIYIDGNGLDGNQAHHTDLEDGGISGIKSPAGYNANVVMQFCEIHNCYTDGVQFNGAYLRLENCEITKAGRNGVTANSEITEVLHCKLDGNGVRCDPRSQFHVEPDNDDYIKFIRLYDSTFTGSVNDTTSAVKFHLAKQIPVDHFIVENCVADRIVFALRPNANSTISNFVCVDTTAKVRFGVYEGNEFKSAYISGLIGNVTATDAYHRVKKLEIRNSKLSSLTACAEHYLIEGCDFSKDEPAATLAVATTGMYINNCVPETVTIRDSDFTNTSYGVRIQKYNTTEVDGVAVDQPAKKITISDCTFGSIQAVAAFADHLQVDGCILNASGVCIAAGEKTKAAFVSNNTISLKETSYISGSATVLATNNLFPVTQTTEG